MPQLPRWDSFVERQKEWKKKRLDKKHAGKKVDIKEEIKENWIENRFKEENFKKIQNETDKNVIK